MPKNILIFSDGTGQIGGMRPDQRLSNIYKMFRAMRPGPSSPIKPSEQVAFYDPGLGAGETNGITIRRIRNLLEASVGTGIDDNVIDCYAAIISCYKLGDQICLFGFSRGAYTVRSVTNVLNLCGIPTRMPDGGAVPIHGPKLRKVASDAVKYVYNHGAGHDRAKYEDEREEKARRFREKYGSQGIGADGEAQGNVQPTFIGVFDTVAALGNRYVSIGVFSVTIGLFCLWIASFRFTPWWITVPLTALVLSAAYWVIVLVKGQFKYFYKDPSKKPNWWNLLEWPSIWRSGHFAWWNKKYYDRYLDHQVRFARHALSIDENRKSFPRVGWGNSGDYERNKDLKPEWMKQVWFAGNHSDIGGSYLEAESRLSDISLSWMLEELKEALPSIQIRDNLVVTSPDPLGLQHDQVVSTKQRWKIWTWRTEYRDAGESSELHPSVIERLSAESVPILDEMKPYRPNALSKHEVMKSLDL